MWRSRRRLRVSSPIDKLVLPAFLRFIRQKFPASVHKLNMLSAKLDFSEATTKSASVRELLIGLSSLLHENIKIDIPKIKTNFFIT